YSEAGFDQERIRVKPNFAWKGTRREGPGDYFLFLGRLSFEKGPGVLLDAWKSAPGRLVIVGDGPEGERLRALGRDRVEFVGSVRPSEALRYLKNARAVLVQSLCYEVAPRKNVEAYAWCFPVVRTMTR